MDPYIVPKYTLTFDLSYVLSFQTNQTGADKATPTYIRGTDKATPAYIRWTLIIIPKYTSTFDLSYVLSLQTNQPGTDKATPTYIRRTLRETRMWTLHASILCIFSLYRPIRHGPIRIKPFKPM